MDPKAQRFECLVTGEWNYLRRDRRCGPCGVTCVIRGETTGFKKPTPGCLLQDAALSNGSRAMLPTVMITD